MFSHPLYIPCPHSTTPHHSNHITPATPQSLCIPGRRGRRGTQGRFITHGEFHACGGRGGRRWCWLEGVLASGRKHVFPRPAAAPRTSERLIKRGKTASLSPVITGFRRCLRRLPDWFILSEQRFPFLYLPVHQAARQLAKPCSQLRGVGCSSLSRPIRDIHAGLCRLISLSPRLRAWPDSMRLFGCEATPAGKSIFSYSR